MPTLVASQRSTLPRVNLLPPEIEERRRFRRIQLVLAATVVAAVGAVGGFYVVATGAVADARQELDTVNAQNRALQAEAGQYAAVPATYAAVETAETQLVQAMGQEVRWSYYLNDLSLTIPGGVWLEQMTMTQAVGPSDAAVPAATDFPTVPGIGQVQFVGKAKRHDDVASWLDALAEQKGYAEAYLSSSVKEPVGAEEPVTYTTEVKLTDDALSRRYTTKAAN